MIVVTSLSCKHANATSQQEAVKSWQKLGYVHSLNTSAEIEQISGEYFGVNFVETHRTVEALFGKSCISINAFFDYAIENKEDLFIINSDIHLTELPSLHTDGITIFSRWDFQNHFGEGKIFNAGFDAFFIPKQFLHIFPPSAYALGIAWHDYFTPMMAIINNIPVYWPQGKYAYHKIHKTQYSVEEWLYIGEFFKWQFKVSPQLNIGEMATRFLNIIKSKAIKTQ